MAKKERVDTLLVEQGLVETREKAKRTIMAGLVYAEDERIDKPGMKIDNATPLHLKGELLPYVSRGGLKLQKALDVFPFTVEGRTVLDIGASTGGFTDCALQHGAKHVYAVDVGYNQLAWKLRTDERVTVMERVNFRYVTADQFEGKLPEVAVCDVSFISLRLILTPLTKLLPKGGDVCVLIKPQFEAGREEVGKKGIVRDPVIHKKVVTGVIRFAEELGYQIQGLDISPITGTEGNKEFLLHAKWDGAMPEVLFPPEKIETVISSSLN
ncbi:TlyA family rRNA (cytidine-2'-O)-methyltransferase [Salsuginibacillus kocurii]|uniref:TlyA family rRNA (cytidine-2'-O)-methyltransferase n=1 Tax=Salsuginibacillus kocurii TaxID=427078 RepID=UPI0003716BEE